MVTKGIQVGACVSEVGQTVGRGEILKCNGSESNARRRKAELRCALDAVPLIRAELVHRARLQFKWEGRAYWDMETTEVH